MRAFGFYKTADILFHLFKKYVIWSKNKREALNAYLARNMKKRHQQKFIIVSIILLIGLNLPIALLFDSAQNLLGFPVIYIYIFSLWLFSILTSFLIVKRYNE